MDQGATDGDEMGQRDRWRSATTRFRWLSQGRIPAEFDLRRCGWTRERETEAGSDGIGVVLAADADALALDDEARRLVLVVGVGHPADRSALLERGFGEVVGSGIDLIELGARAGRVAEFARWLPRQRRLGPLLLDLLAREAYGHAKPLNLNPREFALLWRLADTPNQPVSKPDLIQDVWRMGFVPETNSIAVHMSRLRRKLAFVGLEGIVETAPSGGYCLATGGSEAAGDGRGIPLVAPARNAYGLTLKH